LNIEIRKLKDEDIPLALRWINGRRGGEYAVCRLPSSPAEAETWLSGSGQYDCMVELYGTPIGLAGFTGIDHGGSARLYLLLGEVGYNSTRSATYSALLMLKRGFYEFGLDTVYLSTAAGNSEARQIFEGMGFRGISGPDDAEMILSKDDFQNHEFLF
jgi:RimJ/RimL family protein N-acetyltransferase